MSDERFVEALMLGGSHDGEWTRFDRVRRTLECVTSQRMDVTAGFGGAVVSDIATVNREVYRNEEFGVPDRRYTILVHESLSLGDATRMLVEGYRRPKA